MLYKRITSTFSLTRLPRNHFSSQHPTPYEILGVSRIATKKEIKKAFNDLTKLYHPDKDPDHQDKYTEINNAYQTLSNEAKRSAYDHQDILEEEPFDMDFHKDFGGFEYEEYGSDWHFEAGENNNYERVFRDYDDFFKFPESTYRKQTAVKGQNILINLELSFPEAVNGSAKEVTFYKRDVCRTCEGARSRPGTTPIKCKACDCTGCKSVREGDTVIKTECRRCNGKGYIIKEKCLTCEGEGTEYIEHSEVVHIPRGVRNGHEIRLLGKGNKGDHGGLRGDVSIVVRLVRDEYYKVDGYDLHVDKHISLSKSILGGDEVVETIDGEVTVQVPKHTGGMSCVKLEDKGLKGLHDEEVRGDFYVWFRVMIPEKISVQQLEVLRKIKDLELNARCG